MDDGGLAAELDVRHLENAGAFLRASQEVGVEGDGVGLVLRFQCGREVQLGHGEEVAAYDAAVGDWEEGLTCEVLEKGGGNTFSNGPVIGEVALVGVGVDSLDCGGFCEGGGFPVVRRHCQCLCLSQRRVQEQEGMGRTECATRAIVF